MSRLDDGALDRLEPGGALAQPLERLVDGLVLDRRLRAPQFDRRQVAGIERRHDVERGGKRERLALLDDEILDVGAVDGLETAFGERVLDGVAHEVLSGILQDLPPEALPDDLGGHLAGPETRQAAALP